MINYEAHIAYVLNRKDPKPAHWYTLMESAKTELEVEWFLRGYTKAMTNVLGGRLEQVFGKKFKEEELKSFVGANFRNLVRDYDSSGRNNLNTRIWGKAVAKNMKEAFAA